MKLLGTQVSNSSDYQDSKKECVNQFLSWNEDQQVEFVQDLLSRMCHVQHGQIEAYLKPMLQRDFVSALPGIVIIL